MREARLKHGREYIHASARAQSPCSVLYASQRRTLLSVQGRPVDGRQARILQRQHIGLQVEAHQLRDALNDVLVVHLLGGQHLSASPARKPDDCLCMPGTFTLEAASLVNIQGVQRGISWGCLSLLTGAPQAQVSIRGARYPKAA